jgi:methylated-DNA-protein-cysteine methyltransferase-like protein
MHAVILTGDGSLLLCHDSRGSGSNLRKVRTVMKPEYLKVFEAIAAIPPGRVASYGAIAARAGLPGRARLVGRLLGEVPDGMTLPWFRVLRSSGQIAMPPGSRGFREQCRLLRAEGVEVTNGRVALSRFGLDADVDRQLWGLP